MGELLNRIRFRISEIFNSLSGTKKIMLAVGSVVVVLAIALIIFFATRQEYVTLVQGVDPSRAGEITAKLDESAIPYSTDDAASTISVPKDSISKAKMLLAVDGLLAGEKDFTWTDAFSQSSLTMSNEEKAKMYLQAQASGLEQSIETIEGVEKARVQLYVPSDITYVLNPPETYESRASVLIKLKSGFELDKQQVNGIVMILVNSVKGLDKTRVSVVNDQGIELTSALGADPDMMGTGAMFEMKQSVEARLQTQLTEFLANLYGKENVKVMPSVTLDSEDRTTESVKFATPVEGETNGLIRSVNEITKTVDSGAAATGAPGTDSNTAGTDGTATTYPSDTETASNIAEASKTLNYELNEINDTISSKKGQIKDITIGILINSEVLVGNKLTDEAKEELVNLVTTAAGVETKSVIVSAQQFAKDESVMVDSTPKAGTFPILPVVGLLLATAAAIAGFVLYRRKVAKDDAEKKRMIEEEKLRKERELEEIQLAQDTSSPKYQIEKFISSNPEVVAQLLRNWLNEE